MIIECPYCSTRFRLAEETIGDERPTLRCSQCRNTFPLPLLPDDEAESPEPELSFTYSDEAEEDPAARRKPDTASEPDLFHGTAERTENPLPQPSLFGDFDRQDQDFDDLPDSGDSLRTAFEDEPELGWPERDDTDDTMDREGREQEDEAVKPSFQIPLLIFLASVVGAYALLSWTLRSDPDWALNTLQRLPMIGSDIKANKLGRSITLDDMHGRYERTKEGKTIFLVTGNARNDHDLPVQNIRIALKLFDASGFVIAEQATACGNALRPDLVRDLTVQQVAILRGWGIKPPQDTPLNPGESCPLVSIFLDVPDTVGEFSGEVTQARRFASRS